MNVICTFWFDLALITGVLGFRLCSAMFEAVIGTIAQLSLGATLGAGVFGAKLDLQILKLTRREAASIGSVSFFVPFFNSAVGGEYLQGWRAMPSWRRPGRTAVKVVLMAHARVRVAGGPLNRGHIPSVAIATASFAPLSSLRASSRLQCGGCF
jgi:hypothetical protein